jgi:hypothetical protein
MNDTEHGNERNKARFNISSTRDYNKEKSSTRYYIKEKSLTRDCIKENRQRAVKEKSQKDREQKIEEHRKCGMAQTRRG